MQILLYSLSRVNAISKLGDIFDGGCEAFDHAGRGSDDIFFA